MTSTDQSSVIAPNPVIASPSDPVIASEARQSMPPVPATDDEISLLDLLQVVADNLRLLVLGPLPFI